MLGEHGTDGAAGIGRRLVVVGTGTYRHLPGLPLVPEELRAAVDVFGGLGYRVEERVTDADLATVRDRLRDWAYRTDGAGTAVVLYWTGHGIGDPGRHYLLCADSHPDRLVGTALPAEDLTRYVLASGAERVLLVIDTCEAGQGGADATTVAEGLRAALRQGAADNLGGRPGPRGHPLTDFAVIAVARAGEAASPMVFASALETALARLSVSHKQQYLSVSQVVDTVNDIYGSVGIRQTARALVESERHSFFSFENTGYRPEARYDEGDVAELTARLARTGPEARRRRADLETHFAPRGQGFEHTAPGRHGSYFVGRTDELDRIGRWLAHGDRGGRRGLVVTGGPGVGKSALLGKLLLRSAARTATLPVPTAIHARHRFLEDLVAAVADAAGITATTPQALLGALAARRAPLHLIVDALDEAGEAHGDDTEARRIAKDLLRPLLRVPCVRLLVGTRPHVLDAFDGAPDVIDLDDVRESSVHDVARYARRLLQAPDGPGSEGPYDDTTAVTVAGEIAARAHGSFLSARIAARHLGRAARAVDTTAPDWRTRVPEVGETPGVTFLRVVRHRLGPDRERGLALLAALALAEGPGLPPDAVWRAAAGACADPRESTSFTWEDIAWLLEAVGEHLVEELDADGRSVYRLYHQAYAEALRATVDPGARSRVAHALAALVPQGPDGPDWAAAPPYVRRHLAEHAEGTDLLDELALDPAFLLTAGTSALQRVLNRATTEPARAAARAVGHCAALLRTRTDHGTRAAQLRLSAFQSGAGELAAAVRRRYPDLPWDTEWAEVAPVPYTTIGTFAAGLLGAGVVSLRGRPALVTAERDGPVRAWDTEGGELLTELPDDLGPITAVHGCPTRPWAALRTAERIWVWDVETRDLIGAVAAPPDTVDCALTELGGACLVAVLDRKGTVTLAVASGDTAPLVLRADPRRHLRRPFDGVFLAVEVHGGVVRVAVTRAHRRRDPFRRVRLTVWELTGGSPDTLTVHRQVRRSLRGREVAALTLRRGTVAVATEGSFVLWGPERPKATERDGVRVVEWNWRVHGRALLLAPGPGPGAGTASGTETVGNADDAGSTSGTETAGDARTAPATDLVCFYASAHTVTAEDVRGTVVGRTRTDAPVRRLLAAGHGPHGPRLVALGAADWSAKTWDLGPPLRDGDALGAPRTTVTTGRYADRPVVVVRDASGVRLLDGATGVRLDGVEGTQRGAAVAAHPGAPILRWDLPRRWREPAGIRVWAAETPLPLTEVRRLFEAHPVPGDGPPRFVAAVGVSKNDPYHLALHTSDGRVGPLVETGIEDFREVRSVPDGAADGRVVVSVVGKRYYPPVGGDDGSFDSPPPRPFLVVRSLPDNTIRFTTEVHSEHVIHDLGRWPEGPVLGVVSPTETTAGRGSGDGDGELTVRTRFPATYKEKAVPPTVVPRPDRVRVTALRLQTRHGRPTVLTAGADGGLTLFDAETTEVLHRILLGGEILRLEWLDDERLCVHTATGQICLRLP
ncbi:AAA family ATPase [Streptomyces sp. TX20-6-3]|uniref:AAA family ATPase n=1 Tax=Streptomyces sp. TX20-6-3 TaxID=3028705 RepID=UPI0029A44416|nr:AAA family ATPase [Streptomyces sp. TX20-6-3]MDX2563563.1 AAA family ATPase [Streptomyces sp. TX20-6-3]